MRHEAATLNKLWCIITGKVGGLRGHRWLLMAVESKVVIHDMVSGGSREAVRSSNVKFILPLQQHP